MPTSTRLSSPLAGAASDLRLAKDAAKVTITYADARRGLVLDVNADEVEELASKGTRQARRGRRPKAVS